MNSPHENGSDDSPQTDMDCCPSTASNGHAKVTRPNDQDEAAAATSGALNFRPDVQGDTPYTQLLNDSPSRYMHSALQPCSTSDGNDSWELDLHQRDPLAEPDSFVDFQNVSDGGLDALDAVNGPAPEPMDLTSATAAPDQSASKADPARERPTRLGHVSVAATRPLEAALRTANVTTSDAQLTFTSALASIRSSRSSNNGHDDMLDHPVPAPLSSSTDVPNSEGPTAAASMSSFRSDIPSPTPGNINTGLISTSLEGKSDQGNASPTGTRASISTTNLTTEPSRAPSVSAPNSVFATRKRKSDVAMPPSLEDDIEEDDTQPFVLSSIARQLVQPATPVASKVNQDRDQDELMSIDTRVSAHSAFSLAMRARVVGPTRNVRVKQEPEQDGVSASNDTSEMTDSNAAPRTYILPGLTQYLRLPPL
ncbi:hypothetical protein DFJ77DRAFT_514089 [Powellomyces hirtus]|nr:hypothetical protein DFJ77DRAFT_514089 [Powellomyces hirtus]